MNFVEELRWRGMLHDIMPDTETYLLENKVTGYIGFDQLQIPCTLEALFPLSY